MHLCEVPACIKCATKLHQTNKIATGDVRLFNIFRDPVMLKRKSVVLLPVYAAVRTRTSSESYRNQYGANDWSLHDKYLNSEAIFG